MAVRLGLIMPSMISRGRSWLYSLVLVRASGRVVLVAVISF
jgi:hypothetical protein